MGAVGVCGLVVMGGSGGAVWFVGGAQVAVAWAGGGGYVVG